jgi:hypothetical protein
MRKKIIILSLLPFLLIIASVITASLIDFINPLTEKEQQLLDVTHESVGIFRKEASVVKNNLKSPIEIPETFTPPISTATAGPGKGVSLIMIREEEKIAIINGKVAREGDIIDKMEILKIEKDKILVKSNRTKWIFMEERR